MNEPEDQPVALPETEASAEIAPVSGGVERPCPTCGTAQPANRCDVCGHQWEDS